MLATWQKHGYAWHARSSAHFLFARFFDTPVSQSLQRISLALLGRTSRPSVPDLDSVRRSMSRSSAVNAWMPVTHSRPDGVGNVSSGKIVAGVPAMWPMGGIWCPKCLVPNALAHTARPRILLLAWVSTNSSRSLRMPMSVCWCAPLQYNGAHLLPS